jgi:hypothetical protein
MPRMLLAAALVAVAGLAPAADYPFPNHVLKSDALTVTVFLPDAENGFYRGTRFDWSGVFRVQFGQHQLFGPWKDRHDPTNNDDIVGPCEEFGMAAPLGYADAKVGETFVKIGVGELVKPKEEKYNFFGKYTIAKPGEWAVEKAADQITFTQSLKAASGYGYKYAKTVSVKGAELRIAHTLENTGTKPLSTDHYNHNFFNVNGDAVGKNYELEFPFEPKAAAPKERFAELVKLDGKMLTLSGPLDKGSIYAELSGFSKEPRSKDAAVTMKHTPTGVTVRVVGDQPPSKFNVWGIKTTLCPEPFLQFDLAPGKKTAWTWVYTFSKK